MDFEVSSEPIYLDIWLMLKEKTDNFKLEEGIVEVDNTYNSSYALDVLNFYYSSVIKINDNKFMFKEKKF